MTNKILDVARWVAIVVVIGFAVRVLTQNWSEFWRTLRGIPWETSALSMLALVVAMGVSTLGWVVVVDGLGTRLGFLRGARICLVGQLGKYVPGSLWAYLLQMELGRKAGLSRARVASGSLIQFCIGLVAALPLALLAAPNGWVLAALPAVVLLHPKVVNWSAALARKLLRRPPIEVKVSGWAIAKAFAAAVAAWTMQGVHLWLLAGTNAPLLTCIGAMALAMTSGTFAFLLPSGAGVREAVLVAVLSSAGIPAGQALAFALASRVMFTVADLFTALAAAGTSKWAAQSGREHDGAHLITSE
ncbi:lysylphosphatidylglycerol synthase transmembrane domain-containing protein [Amycolatopsis acididurans]|uniref:lysylphosphatidylglycerol synthase transmembrane domain-containing protein n=1 Tax=Amycolatopsis acididurans TaxID=2724524 RepID=UPI0028A9B9FA|nr:lysylphosphatidylglycerol synthase transmembrane domain-containing protein [Amycolatopsis acididurans]